MSSTIGLYFRRDQGSANALRSRLNEIAATFGYTATRGATTGQGNLSEMLEAIDAGELALVLLPDEHFRPALEALDAISAQSRFGADNWAAGVARALRAALERGVEAEKAELDNYK